MFLYFLFPMIMLIPVGIYYYFFFRRMLSFFNVKIAKLIQFLLIMISSIIVVLCSNIYGVWIVIFMHLFVYSILMDLLVLYLKRKQRCSLRFKKVYMAGIIPIIFTSLTLIYAYYNMNNVVEKDYTIYTEKSLDFTYKVVLVSDLHFGTTMKEEKLKDIAKEIEKLKPSLVILAGDIVDENTSKKQMKNAFSILGNIESKYGVFFVYGNHDKSRYYGNRNYSVEELDSAINDAGIIQLVDTTYEINDELILIGRDDSSFPKGNARKSSNELIETLNKEKFLLLIDHHPYDLDENSKNGYDLQLSGHTHGGQIFPTGLITEIFDRKIVNYGYRKNGNLNIIVSSGIGGWAYPFRTGNNSEYVVITVKNEN